MVGLCLLLLKLFHPATGIITKRTVTSQFIANRTDSLCQVHPFGVIFSEGESYDCIRENKIPFENLAQGILQGVKLRVGIIQHRTDYDYDCIASYGRNGLQPEESYSFHILQLLQEVLNFDTEFIPATTWGHMDPAKGNWTGLVGLIEKDFADMAICHSTITKPRAEVVDFLISTLHSSRSLIYQPSRLPLTRDVFVLTFSQTLWYCFAGSIFLLIVCFRFSTWQHSRLRPDHEPWSWMEVIMWANAAICQQSYSRHPEGSSCRTMFLIGYVITYLLYTGFAAGVTSLLAVQGHGTHLTFADVVVMKLNLVLQSPSTQFDFLSNSTDSYARSIVYNSMEMLLRNKVETLDQLFDKLENENFIAFGSSIPIINHLRRKINPTKAGDFTVSRIERTDWQKAFLIKRRSPYRELFNYWLIRLKEIGLLDYGKKKYVHIIDVSSSPFPGWSSAGLGNVLSSVIIFGIGWFFSILILFCEKAWLQKTTGNEWEIKSKEDVLRQYYKGSKPTQFRY